MTPEQFVRGYWEYVGNDCKDCSYGGGWSCVLFNKKDQWITCPAWQEYITRTAEAYINALHKVADILESPEADIGEIYKIVMEAVGEKDQNKTPS